ncbi:MAG: hypothetical protein CVU97_00665 [Firmicutes bacterium HGW-Firmicutes-21]|nr:MAG: hypothetical protein CVU97_00665 [Firmicutes bacterium HGW-Firmicutes-21]
MLKKIFVLLLALSFTLAFAACDKDDTTSEVSTESQAVSEAESEDESDIESEVSEEVLSGVVDGTYYGVGYSFDIPEGYELLMEMEGKIIFMGEDFSMFMTMIADTEKSASGYTEEDFFTDFGDDNTDADNMYITSFEVVEIAGMDAIHMEYIEEYDEEDEENNISQTSYLVFKSGKVVVVGFYMTEDEIITALMDSLSIG